MLDMPFLYYIYDNYLLDHTHHFLLSIRLHEYVDKVHDVITLLNKPHVSLSIL